MYELFNGIISILGGIYLLLLVSGKIKTSKPEFIKNSNKMLKMIALFLISFGFFSSLRLVLA